MMFYRIVFNFLVVFLCAAAPSDAHAFFNNWMQAPKKSQAGAAEHTPYGSPETYKECQSLLKQAHKNGQTKGDNSEKVALRKRCEVLAAAEDDSAPIHNTAQKSP